MHLDAWSWFYAVATVLVVGVELTGVWLNKQRKPIPGGRTISEQVWALLRSPFRVPVYVGLATLLGWLPGHFFNH